MKYRKLRIAWSVVWGLAALVLICLWARSYLRIDTLEVTTQPRRLILEFALGVVGLCFQHSDEVSGPFFYANSAAIDESLADGIRWRDRDLTFGFGFDNTQPPTKVSFPCWFLMLLVVSTATGSWLPW